MVFVLGRSRFCYVDEVLFIVFGVWCSRRVSNVVRAHRLLSYSIIGSQYTLSQTSQLQFLSDSSNMTRRSVTEYRYLR